MLKRMFFNFFLCTLATILGGCFGSAPTSYYVIRLEGQSFPLTVESKKLNRVIEVGPVSLPAYLDRKGLMTLTAPLSYQVSNTHLWADSLDVLLAEAVAKHPFWVSYGLRTVLYPKPTRENSYARVALDVTRFDVNQQNAGIIQATWIVQPQKGKAYTHSITKEQQCISKEDQNREFNHVTCLNQLFESAVNELFTQLLENKTVALQP